jgi:hypothetical protein
MKINILFTSLIYLINPLLTFQALAFDPEKLNGDLEFIEQSFLKEHSNIDQKQLNIKSPNNLSSKVSDLKVINLEEKYFDQVSTKKAALSQKETKTKRRAR